MVTRIFEDAQATADERGDIEVILHTKTPVTGFERIRDTNPDKQQQASQFINGTAQIQQRRWKLQTPRGSILCNYVVHATNGYAAHLLPFLAGQGVAEDERDADVHHQMSNAGTDSEAAAGPHQHPLFQSYHHILPKPKPRGMYGIIPTRGQVGAVRASVRAGDLGWRNSWVRGDEYWFPRYQGLEGTKNGSDAHARIKTETSTGNDWENGTAQTENMTISNRNPLIILGGGRQHAGGNMESGETNDGVLNERVGKALRKFLPRWFPGKFEDGDGGWEIEWVSNTFFFFVFEISSEELIPAGIVCSFFFRLG